MRIPIREWSKDYDPRTMQDVWKLSVLINGSILAVNVQTPSARWLRVDQIPREYIVKAVAQRIAAVVADEIQRSIA